MRQFFKKKQNKGKKVFVGLSGGVDSALSALILKNEGYDVTGVFIKGWQPDWLPCTWREERRDAMRVASSLDINFISLDLEKEYKESVVDKIIEEYKKNRTPNPDILCNRAIKFGLFWEKARLMGAHFIATGHYAQVMKTEEGLRMYESADEDKDQTYFLWTIREDELAHIMFPIGQMKKKDVRALAKSYKLPNANKKDSQGICFMGSVSMDEFLSKHIEVSHGDVADANGKIIGTHKGLVFYTIGERHGFFINNKTNESRPYYVIKKDIDNNILIVSDSKNEIESMSPTSVYIKDLNLIGHSYTNIKAKIRYRGDKINCNIKNEKDRTFVDFEKPVTGLSLGQSIVFYMDNMCIGGAVLDEIR